MLHILWFLACSTPKDTAAPSDTSAPIPDSCDEAREGFLAYKSELFSDPSLRACASYDDCVTPSCSNYCGVSCVQYHANDTYHVQISQKLYEYHLENCQACSDYEYDPPMPEPEGEPPGCNDGICSY